MTADRIPTGLASFDEMLGGGIPAGSVVAVSTPPESPIGLLLAELVSADDLDSITYLTTDRRPAAIRRQLGSPDTTDAETLPTQLDLIDARTDTVHTFGAAVDELPAQASATTADPAPAATQEHEAAGTDTSGDERPSRANSQAMTASNASSTDSTTEGAGAVDAVVVDSLTGVFSNATDQWNDHFDSLVAWAREGGGVAYLVLRLPPVRAPSAVESQVLYRADVVFEYRRGEDGGTDDRLAVPKFRGGARPSDPITLEISDRLGINPDRRV